MPDLVPKPVKDKAEAQCKVIAGKLSKVGDLVGKEKELKAFLQKECSKAVKNVDKTIAKEVAKQAQKHSSKPPAGGVTPPDPKSIVLFKPPSPGKKIVSYDVARHLKLPKGHSLTLNLYLDKKEMERIFKGKEPDLTNGSMMIYYEFTW